jgi:hypothetical protein
MILSHSHKFCFVSVPKTGTHSIDRALRKTKATGDVFQHYHTTDARTRFPEPELSSDDDAEGHIPLTRLAPFYDLSGYFKFGFVRNPWDKFLSFCAWTNLEFVYTDAPNLTYKNDPHKFMTTLLRKMHNMPRVRTMLAPCSEFLIDASGTIGVDYVGRFERIQEDFDVITNRLGVEGGKLARLNSSGDRRDYRSLYTTSLVDKVAEAYKSDITLFGYTFE